MSDKQQQQVDQLSVHVLFGKPQQEIASTLTELTTRSDSFSMMTGFATVEGIKLLAPAFRATPKKLECLVVGSSTQRGFDAIDSLVGMGVPKDRLFVHLGHTRPSTYKFEFYRYHPMLHSKIYLFNLPNEMTVAVLGSHNITGFALDGLNAEASVRLEGHSSHPEFGLIRRHIDDCRKQSVQYDPLLKEAYVWWMLQFLDGLKAKVADRQREYERKETILILCQTSLTPQAGEDVYFEIPAPLSQSALHADVHIYAFEKLPQSPKDALDMLSDARLKLHAKTCGIENYRGGIEILANWRLDEKDERSLTQVASGSYRPQDTTNKQQVRARIEGLIHESYAYLFDSDKSKWRPSYDHSAASEVKVPEGHRELLMQLQLVPDEHEKWFLVNGLQQIDAIANTSIRDAYSHMSPSSGKYLLLARRRIKREK